MKRTTNVTGIIFSVLTLISCSEQAINTYEKQSIDLDAQITQSIDSFNNRSIHKELTYEIIDNTSDDDLLQVVFDNLMEKLPHDYKKEYETVLTWNKSKQAIYLIWVLEAEVNNGGYNQFYFNPGGQFYKFMPESLRLIGANKFAKLTERANNTFEKENKQISEKQDGSIEGFSRSYEDNPLNNFDNEFYELYKIENLQQIQVDYIRKNKHEFIDK